MRFLRLALIVVGMLATPVAAQQTEPDGPFVMAISDENLVLIATGPARRNLIVTFSVIGGRVRRIEAEVQANCAAGQYRTGPMELFDTDRSGARGTFLVSIPGLDWVPFTPDDTIVRNYVCSGTVTGQSYRTPEPALAAWFDRQGY